MKHISFKIDETKLPVHTKDDLIEWIGFKLGARSDMRADNPLDNADLEAIQVNYGNL